MLTAVRTLTLTAAASCALLLAGCGRDSEEADLASLDNEIAANDTDPAVTSALGDQIAVDPTLSQQSNRTAVRTPAGPAQAQLPGGRGVASLRASVDGGGGCAAKLDYAMGWANRLPPAFAVYPGSKVTEAAANDSPECRLRVVTFTTDEAPQRLLDHYSTNAVRAGYTAEQQRRDGDILLGGTNEGNGTAYVVIVTPKGAGADVALIANAGT